MRHAELIEMAAKAAGGKSKLAQLLEKAPARVSEWLSGKGQPSDDDVMLMAELAGLPQVNTLLSVKAESGSKYAARWRDALGKLTAAGIAATVTLATGMTPERANAEPHASQRAESQSVYYVNRLRRLLSRLFGRYSRNRFQPMEMGC